MLSMNFGGTIGPNKSSRDRGDPSLATSSIHSGAETNEMYIPTKHAELLVGNAGDVDTGEQPTLIADFGNRWQWYFRERYDDARLVQNCRRRWGRGCRGAHRAPFAREATNKGMTNAAS